MSEAYTFEEEEEGYDGVVDNDGDDDYDKFLEHYLNLLELRRASLSLVAYFRVLPTSITPMIQAMPLYYCPYGPLFWNVRASSMKLSFTRLVLQKKEIGGQSETRVTNAVWPAFQAKGKTFSKYNTIGGLHWWQSLQSKPF
jgi:hypothetical protein